LLEDWRSLIKIHIFRTDWGDQTQKPATALTLEDGRVLHLRKPTVPGAEQATVYQRFEIDWKAASPTQKTWAKGE
jgi:hypothetical protein